ncbi:MAG: symmetrical bis(5'-nucleosyl)-tetraphosphatase [Pusillimonas sp.]
MRSSHSVWMVGDLQGCCHPLHALLAHPDIAEDSDARFWFAGDLINRGPDSLGTLRTVMALGDRAITVLGNHDLHLLAIAAGIKKPGKSDTVKDILDAPDAHELITWLRQRPLAHYDQEHLMVHAGALPSWSVEKTLALAAEVESALQGPDWKDMLERMYGNEPAYWDDSLCGGKRLRVIVNALTRMRMCDRRGHMDFLHKGAPFNNGEFMPWFDVPERVIQHETIVFGHWSTLGLMLRPNAICLDTGCVWGRKLTAIRLSDRKLVQIACEQYQDPEHH